MDAASLGLFFGSTSARQPSDADRAVAIAGLVGYVVGAPIVHVFHEHWGKAGASFGLRAGSTALLFAGVLTCDANSLDECGTGSQLAAVVGSLGFIAAIPVDAAAIASEDIEPEGVTGLNLIPWIATSARGGGMSVARRW